jgi:hypothetical protein
VTAGKDQVSLRVSAAEAVDKRPNFSVRLGRHGAAIDHANVRIAVVFGYDETCAGQAVPQLGHLSKVDLASERLDRDSHD